MIMHFRLQSAIEIPEKSLLIQDFLGGGVVVLNFLKENPDDQIYLFCWLISKQAFSWTWRVTSQASVKPRDLYIVCKIAPVSCRDLVGPW